MPPSSAQGKSSSDRNARIREAADLYHRNLCDRTVLFVHGRPGSLLTVEAEFKPGYFPHLVGIRPADAAMKPSALYRKALDGRLGERDYSFTTSAAYADMKLEVIGRVMRIDVNARMIGDFQGSRFINLDTDKVVGRSNAVLGLIEAGDVFVPNSVINADIREVSRETSQVLASFKKDVADPAYGEARYLAKSLGPEAVAEMARALEGAGLLLPGAGIPAPAAGVPAARKPPSPGADARRASASAAARGGRPRPKGRGR